MCKCKWELNPIIVIINKHELLPSRGGLRRAGADFLSTQMVPPLLEISILAKDPKNFLKAPKVPICTNFKGGAFCGLFFKFLPAARSFYQNRVFLVLWGSS